MAALNVGAPSGCPYYILFANAISRRAANGRPYSSLCEPFDKSKFEFYLPNTAERITYELRY